MLGDDGSKTCLISRQSGRWPVAFTITDLEEPSAAEGALDNWPMLKAMAERQARQE
jgi:hypothetical protein